MLLPSHRQFDYLKQRIYSHGLASMADESLRELPKIAYRVIAEEAIRNQLHNLERTIGQLVEMAKALPEGNLRNELFDKISCLDSIGDVMRQALDLLL
jgi:hypothetical protein